MLPRNLNAGPYCPLLAELGAATESGVNKLLRAYGDVLSTLQLPVEYPAMLGRRVKN